ncbi:hypothetical protein [Legionella tunisiensis]|uniref:hypothetical protein n=1 Tax=Legionella tunisiensis TaxID=1034944 RepID=UPI001E3DDE06|nr:hypothetical protein [Legionella tunisiensis]
MEFVLPPRGEEDEQIRACFTIKHKNSEEGMICSNRPSQKNEIRGALLRQRLLELKRKNSDLTLYNAMQQLFKPQDIETFDIFRGFTTSMMFEHASNLDKQLTAALAKKIIQYIKNHEEATAEEIIAYVGPLVAGTRDGLELLEDTLRSDTDNTKALGNVLFAVKSGTLMVNGQTPDEAYVIGEYLIHGGRIKFDLSELSPTQQEQFFAFITNGQASPRAFATHRAGGTDANNSPAETKSGLFGAIIDAFRALSGYPKHYGIHLPVGGNQTVTRAGECVVSGLGQTPDESGEWGHMYLHKDTNLVLVGIEGSAPGKKNKRTGEAHSWTGGSGTISPFWEWKINSKNLRTQQEYAEKTPLTTAEKNNWATVKISSEQFPVMMEAAKNLATQSYLDLVREIPSNAQPAEKNRMEKMQAWAKATKRGNETSLLTKLFGILLFVVGVVLTIEPIPGVAQAAGSWLMALGWSMAGLGLLLLVSALSRIRQNPKHFMKKFGGNATSCRKSDATGYST